MADTRQVVRWSLERKCTFRNGDRWFLPDQTFKQLADFRTVAAAEGDNRNVNGICVTGWTTERDNAGKVQSIPVSGFRIEDRLGPFGGLPMVLSTCHLCEANAKGELGVEVAGCFGYLDVWPDSEELDKQLWTIIEQRHLESRIRSAFPLTTPLWYGFWIESPLRRLQAEVLHELLNAACDYADPKDKDVRHFLNALDTAIRWELPVHVSLSPLGHTDFGWYTVFPHCPRCKANASVGRWKENYQATAYECRVCGHEFNPDDHHSMERDDFDWDANSLEKQLGPMAYQQFIKSFLLQRGCSSGQVDEVVDNKNNGPLIRRIKATRRKRNGTLRRLRQRVAEKSDGDRPSLLSFAIADDIELEMVLVPAGEFLMGSPNADQVPSEAPQHPVRIYRPLYIGRFPVTQAQWSAVMGRNPSKHQGDPRLPIDQVSWFDCQDFCDRLCKRLQRVFRLPSEAEWEYACRAGTTSKFAFGDSLLPTQANFTPFIQRFGMPPDGEEDAVRELEQLVESGPRHDAQTTPVGSYPPNAWGIYDMHGNVDEWCEDVWHPNYDGAPNDGSAWLEGENTEVFRVMRGGWCSATEFVCTSSARRQLRADAGSPDEDIEGEEDDGGFMESLFDLMYIPNGFRVVCECP
ncbi:Serine/threonine-protein kinase pkn1 [Anatilimnocola aggregata]|uniref:Serine/threonine-protein kinase pkn1 n=1 Tax=Anatilimnocola aggregata TaxID=2528021 RepID=A0A517Y6I3_9BACT|nr:formylglycine-generating enzyme family protein [Anatilimnocola aggregata]QDU25830.1 Serine/threonine-protein kinase pkn1 [Anatilimnocola aggregata]